MSDAAAEPGLRIDVNDPTNLPLVESSRFAVRAEELGFAGVGMPDHPHTGRDVFVRLTLAAQRTERVTLFPSVANPVSRDPRMLATLAATLGELAPGRARLVVGSGQNAVQYVGVPGATVSQMAATTETVRRTLATEFALEPPVPVYINGSSPRMLEAAGAAADGVYAMVGVDLDVVAAAIEHVQAGALAKRGGKGRASRSLWGCRCSWRSRQFARTRAPRSTRSPTCGAGTGSSPVCFGSGCPRSPMSRR